MILFDTYFVSENQCTSTEVCAANRLLVVPLSGPLCSEKVFGRHLVQDRIQERTIRKHVCGSLSLTGGKGVITTIQTW